MPFSKDTSLFLVYNVLWMYAKIVATAPGGANDINMLRLQGSRKTKPLDCRTFVDFFFLFLIRKY